MITVHQLTKRFQDGPREVKAVNGLSFQVDAGEVYGLLGPNGAGKTTTLRMIMGLLQPDDGYADAGGFRTSENPVEVKQRVGFVSASAGLYPWLTPRETLLFLSLIHIFEGKTDAAGILATLASAVGLSPDDENISAMGRPIKIAEGQPIKEILS